jgi:hypothetical protein
MTRDEAIEELISSRPRIHWTDQDWGLVPEAMRWLADHVEAGWRTVETGCGQSSILFTLKGANHTIVAPAEWEHENVRKWCEERGFSTENLTSVVSHSERALPSLIEEPIDLALIDGAHAFPFPFVDFLYLATALKPGGYLLVDDTHVRTGAVLREFLLAEEDRWEHEADLSVTTAFRKTSDTILPEIDHVGQPWAAGWSDPRFESARGPVDRLRSVVRPRTRARALAARLRGR